MAFSPTGEHFVTIGFNGRASLYDADTLQRRARIAFDQVISCASFGPEGKTLILGTWDIRDSTVPSKVVIWDIEKGMVQRSMSEPKAIVESVVVSQDGKWFLTASSNRIGRDQFRAVTLYKMGSEQQRVMWKGYESGFHPLAFSPDGKWFATGGANNVVELWDTRSGEKMGSLEGHKNEVISIAISPDGRFLATEGVV